MLNFENLKSANKKTQSLVNDKSDDYELILSEAISIIEQFNQTKYTNKNLLKKAADKLTECINLKSNRVEAYIFQAYIAHVFSNDELTNKFLKIAHYMDPRSELLKSFREMIANQIRNPRRLSFESQVSNSNSINEEKINNPVRIQRISRLK
ncbi:MAG: hypothetical protein H7263_16625 [Candidatus Sericytochromatia bacterium]|nr:hypothetical protein [Candidatus Sericytochromatia bacterium]